MSELKPHITLLRVILILLANFSLAGISEAETADAPAVNEPAKPVEKAAVDEAAEKEPAKVPAEPQAEGKTGEDASKPGETPAVAPVPPVPPVVDPDDAAAVENAEAETAAVARPVSADPVQVYGWREHILVDGVEEKLKAKLDTGALTSSIHAEERELFERDGKKWVRFIVTDPGMKKPARTRIEAPLVRIARIKEPGADSETREVVRLSFRIGDRKMRGEFTLNNRSNMLSPVLIGRSMIKDLGWVDPNRTHLAEQKVLR